MTDDIPARVAALETSVTAIGVDLRDVREAVGTVGGQVTKLVDALTMTDGRAAERAQAVKIEIRDEADRKAKDRGELFKNGLALAGGVSLIVGALCGPYLAKLDQTTTGQKEDREAIAGVRATLAQQGAEIQRNRDSGDIGREKNRLQDDQLLTLNSRVSRIEGASGR